MAVCVDPIFSAVPREAQARRCGIRWCHLFPETPLDLEELHRVAAAIGMRRAWFQDHGDLPHYDLVPKRRAAAVKLGVIEVDKYRLVKAIRAWRNKRWGYMTPDQIKQGVSRVAALFKGGLKQEEADAFSKWLEALDEPNDPKQDHPEIWNAFSDLRFTVLRLRRDVAYLREQIKKAGL